MNIKHVVKLQCGILLLLTPIATASAPTQTWEDLVLHSFAGSDGANPYAGLIMDVSGNLYGTTYGGGAYGYGTVFKLNTSGNLTVLHSFTNSGGDGAGPAADLVMDASGNLYGTTANGGNLNYCAKSGCGVVFKLNSSGSETILHTFTGSGGDGANPEGGLVMDASGNLYGTTQFGGSSGTNCYDGTCGVVFKLNSSGNETILYAFTGSGGDGTLPDAGLVMDSSGNLYGTTSIGGNDYCSNYSLGCGVVFKLDTSNNETILHQFSGAGDGGLPEGDLVLDGSGNLYGTTTLLGAYGNGTAFGLDSSGSEFMLYAFTGSCGEGGQPEAGLVIDASGNLYGTTSLGDASGDGTVFKLVPGPPTSTTTLVSSANPATAGYAVTLTATVTPSWAAGSVAFTNGSTTLATQALSCGTTALSYQDSVEIGIGTLTITAQFTPSDPSSFSSSSASITQIVNESGAAVTNENNTFSGNQTVTGTLTATTLFGSGSGLTNLNPASLTPGTAGINITGNAATATTALTATSATTAVALAGPTAQCGTNMFSVGITASGSANCAQPASTNLSDYLTLVLNNQSNIFAGGKQTLPASAAAYASLNLPNTGAAPSTPAIGDIWLTTADTHLKFQDSTNTTQSLAFLSDVGSGGSNLLSSNNTFTGSNTFSQTINGSISGNAATATNATTATMATTAGSATTAGALAATPSQCGANNFATGIAASGNANCGQPASANLSDHASLVYNNQANTFAGGKQTLAPSTSGYASLNVPNSGPAPTSPAKGDLWLTTANTHLQFLDNTNTTQSVAFLSDVTGEDSTLLSSNNSFTGSNTFTEIINGSISGNAATAATALTATTAGSATTAGALAATPTQCGSSSFATGIAANGNANCAQPAASIAASQILFSSAGIPVWSGAFMGISAPSLIETSVQQIVATSGHITAMQCYSQLAPKGSSETFTLRQNGTSTVAVCTIAAGATSGSVTGLSLPVSAGNLLDLKVGGPTTLGAATIALAVGP